MAKEQGCYLQTGPLRVGRRAAGPGVGDIARGETGRGYAHTGNNRYLFSIRYCRLLTLYFGDGHVLLPRLARTTLDGERKTDPGAAPALSLPLGR